MGQFPCGSPAACTFLVVGLPLLGGRLRSAHAGADADPAARGALQDRRDGAEQAATTRRGRLSGRSSSATRTRSTRPRARFLIGEAFYREAEFDKAIKEFETFLSFYPRHQIADLVQYRLAMSYYDQMKPVEQDQGLTAKALEQFKKLVKEYPESRYADRRARQDRHLPRPARPEGGVGRELLLQPGQPERGAPAAGVVLKEYPRTARDPGGALHAGRGELRRGQDRRRRSELLRRLADEYSYTEWGTPRRPAAPDRHEVRTPVHDIVDLRSDTLTLPTPEMREAMARAEVGDDVWEEDPTVQRLEALAAERHGQGGRRSSSRPARMGNLVSVLAQTQPGQEVVLDARLPHLQLRGGGRGGVRRRADAAGQDRARLPHARRRCASAIRPANIHIAADRTGLPREHPQPSRRHLLHARGDRGGGRRGPRRAACPSISTARGSSTPRSRSSGPCARLRAARRLGHLLPVQGPGRARSARSICGSRDFIARARRVRKMLGGGMRQVGRARRGRPRRPRHAWSTGWRRTTPTRARLAEAVAKLPGLGVDLASVQTNIVDPSRGSRAATRRRPSWSRAARARKVKIHAMGPAAIRCVTHKDVDAEDIARALDAFREITAAGSGTRAEEAPWPNGCWRSRA